MSINLSVVIDNDEAIKKFKELEKVAKVTTSKMVSESDRIDMAMRKIGSTLGTLGVSLSLTEFARQVATVRGEFQQLEVAFTTMLGSKAEADTLMQQAIQLAATTPFDLQGVASGAKQLLAYGSTAKDVAGEIRMLGDIAAGMSLPLGDLVYLYGTTRTQGRLFTRDLMQFTGRGIPLMEELAKQFGVAKSEVGALVTAGKVGFAEVEQALKSMTSQGGKFYNLMEEQSKTITGQMSNLKDSITQMFNDIGKESEGAISKAIGGVSSLVENYEKIGREVIGLIAAYGSYKAAVMLLNALDAVRATYLATQASSAIAATIANKGLAKAITMVGNAIKGSSLAALANPYVLAGAAIAAVVYGIYRVVTAKSAEEKAIERVNEKIDEYRKKQDEEKGIAQQSLETMRNVEATSYERVAAYRKLIETYPELLQRYSEEELKLKSIAELQGEVANIAQERTESQLEADKAALEEKIKQFKNLEKDASAKAIAQAAGAIEELGGLRQAEADLAEIDKRLQEIAKDKEQAKFDALSDDAKLKIYEQRLIEINKELEEYASLLKTADKLRAQELEGRADALINEKNNTQKNINALKNKQQEETDKAGEEAAKKIAQERLKTQEEAYKAEIEAKKAQIDDKIALLEFERDEELKSIRKRIMDAKDAIIEANLVDLWQATKSKFDAQIEQEINNAKTKSVIDSVSFDLRPQTNINQSKLPDPSDVIKTSADRNIPDIIALFDDMRNKSSRDLLAIADDAEKMLWAFSDNPEVLADIRAKIDELRNSAQELQSPLEGIGKAIVELFTSPPDSKAWEQSLSQVRNSLLAIGDVAKGLDSVLESLGTGNALDGVVDGINAAIGALDAAGKGAKMGAIFGPIGSAVGAAVGAIGSLVKSISQIHDKKNEKNIQRLQTQIEDLERGYDKLGRAIEKTYSVDAGKLIEQQNTMLEQQKLLIQQQMAEEKDKKNTDSGKLAEYQRQLDDIDAQIEANASKAAEAYTGISFDEMYNEFLRTLTDMDSSSADFADNFEKYLTNAVLGALMAEKYKKRIEEFHQHFNEAMHDGELTEAEKKELQNEWNQIVDDALADRESLKGITGSGSSSTNFQSESKGFQAMSQETGSELNGRFTDIQGKVTEMRSFVMEILANGKMQYAETVNIRDIMLQLNGNVGDIRTYTKVLPEIMDGINSMNRKLDNL